MHIVTAWRSMSRTAASGGRSPVVGAITAFAPSARNGSIPAHPPMWKSGWPDSHTSRGVAPISWIQLSVEATRLAWVRTAPLGRPVVPDV